MRKEALTAAMNEVVDELKNDRLIRDAFIPDEDMGAYENFEEEFKVEIHKNLASRVDEKIKQKIETKLLDQMHENIHKGRENDPLLFNNQLESGSFNKMYQEAVQKRITELDRQLETLQDKIKKTTVLQNVDHELTDDQELDLNALDLYKQQYIEALIEKTYQENTLGTPSNDIKDSINIKQLIKTADEQTKQVKQAATKQRRRSRSGSLSRFSRRTKTQPPIPEEKTATAGIREDVIQNKVEELVTAQIGTKDPNTVKEIVKMIKDDITQLIDHIQSKLKEVFKFDQEQKRPVYGANDMGDVIQVAIKQTRNLAGETLVTLDALNLDNPNEVKEDIDFLKETMGIDPDSTIETGYKELSSSQTTDYEYAPTKQVANMIDTLDLTDPNAIQFRLIAELAKRDLLKDETNINDITKQADPRTAKLEAKAEVKSEKRETKAAIRESRRGTFSLKRRDSTTEKPESRRGSFLKRRDSTSSPEMPRRGSFQNSFSKITNQIADAKRERRERSSSLLQKATTRSASLLSSAKRPAETEPQQGISKEQIRKVAEDVKSYAIENPYIAIDDVSEDLLNRVTEMVSKDINDMMDYAKSELKNHIKKTYDEAASRPSEKSRTKFIADTIDSTGALTNETQTTVLDKNLEQGIAEFKELVIDLKTTSATGWEHADKEGALKMLKEVQNAENPKEEAKARFLAERVKHQMFDPQYRSSSDYKETLMEQVDVNAIKQEAKAEYNAEKAAAKTEVKNEKKEARAAKRESSRGSITRNRADSGSPKVSRKPSLKGFVKNISLKNLRKSLESAKEAKAAKGAENDSQKDLNKTI